MMIWEKTQGHFGRTQRAWVNDKKAKAPLRALIRWGAMAAVYLGELIHGTCYPRSGKSVSKWFGRPSE
jgi:hypothetical protein